MRAPLSRVVITGPALLVEAAQQAEDDLRGVGTIVGDLEFVTDDSATELRVTAELAPAEA
jgi:valyl-tRNA synthetase